MPRRRTETRTERKQRAFKLYSRGYNPADTARKIGVSYDTASRYHKEWKALAKTSAVENPTLLKEVLQNTIQMLEELDQIRQEAWEQYETAETHTLKNAYLNTMLKAQEQRSRSLGVFGVKQEFFAYVQNIQIIQVKLMDFMRTELCADDRGKLIRMFEEGDLREHIEASIMPTLEAAAGE